MTEVVLLKTAIRDGWPRYVLRALTRVTDRVADDGSVQRFAQRIAAPMLAAEGVHTESIFLERTDDGDYLLWYLEFEDWDRLRRTFDAGEAPIAALSQRLLGFVLENPGEAFRDPERIGEFDLLFHGTGPGRSDPA